MFSYFRPEKPNFRELPVQYQNKLIEFYGGKWKAKRALKKMHQIRRAKELKISPFPIVQPRGVSLDEHRQWRSELEKCCAEMADAVETIGAPVVQELRSNGYTDEQIAIDVWITLKYPEMDKPIELQYGQFMLDYDPKAQAEKAVSYQDSRYPSDRLVIDPFVYAICNRTRGHFLTEGFTVEYVLKRDSGLTSLDGIQFELDEVSIRVTAI